MAKNPFHAKAHAASDLDTAGVQALDAGVVSRLSKTIDRGEISKVAELLCAVADTNLLAIRNATVLFSAPSALAANGPF